MESPTAVRDLTGTDGEMLKRFEVQRGDVFIADRGYANPAGIAHVVSQGGDVLVRMNRLLIDGHNLLPKLKPLIGASYFKTGQGPTAQARALLIERVKTLTELHPLLEADIWFDGPDEQHWSETDNLRVWFSGGLGSDRADGRILECLQSEVYRGPTN